MKPCDAVLAAWTDAGRVPEYHYAMQGELRRRWPVLAGALDSLAAAKGADND